MHFSERTAGMLEWPAFLEFYSQFVASPAARSQLSAIRPAGDGMKEELDLAREALGCAQKDQIPSLGGLEDLALLLKKSAVENQVMEGIEIFRVGHLVGLVNEIRNYAGAWRRENPRLYLRASSLPDLRFLEREILTKIEPTGDVKEDATPELARVMKQIAHLKERVERLLEKYLSDARFQPVLQEDYVTYRHGRAVLVVRIEQKNAIRGVVHGQSGSGASVFVEPFQVLELNNQLAELTDEQRQLILQVLRELTALVGTDSGRLLHAQQTLVDLDLVFARGRFGKAYQCVIPEIREDFHIDLRQARHPLLQSALQREQRQVVPLDLCLEPDRKALIVTGPNTGGKTVLLKTAGLLCIMAHCGLPVPAAEGSAVPRLSGLEADIGDQQSISASLSTFSSHILNIRQILAGLQEHSLVLLDELGTATAPEEGAPLAVAILEELLGHDVKVLATSHHAELKIYGVNHPDCVTAAMEFDEQNLGPTYRVLMDQVGSSHAFDIARRLGLPDSILQRARSQTGVQQQQIDQFQSRLEDRIRVLTQRQAELEREKAEWEARTAAQEEKQKNLTAELEERLKTLKQENTDLVRTLNARFENLIDTIKDAQIRQEIRRQYKQEVAPAVSQLKDLTTAQAEEPQEFQPGDRVWVRLYKDHGSIAAVRKGQAEVVIRNKRFTVPISELEKRETVAQSLPKGVQVSFEQKEVEPELNVIGSTVEEATALVDKYLDDAFLSQVPEVRVIHGHGMGKLKRAIEELLRSHPHVRGFHAETQQRGGTGVTVIQLKTM
jgi:DNA mismatch repair protein MutS2